MPPGHWLWGHLPERARDPLGLYLESQRRLGDVVRYRMGHVHVEQLTHPDHVKHVLADASARYTKGTVFDKTRPLVGNGLLTAGGDFWKRQRRLAQPAFHRERLVYPPIWAIPRVPQEDDVVDGYRIPKGDIVILVPYVTHRHPDFWPEPERFLPENSGARPRWAYLPFGGGQRQCIGNHFAMMVAQLILTLVAQRFRLRGARGCLRARSAWGLLTREMNPIHSEREVRFHGIECCVPAAHRRARRFGHRER